MPGHPIPGESAEYRRLRNELLEAEIALKDQRERVAQLRRQLPMGAAVKQDYIFREGPRDLRDNDPSHFFDTRFSDLFQDGKSSLIVDHLMYAPQNERACPMCSMWADGYDAIAHHVSDKVNFVLVARAPLDKLRARGLRRAWSKIRLLSSYANSFNRDFNVESSDDAQNPAVSVFKRLPNGEIRHFYTTEGSLGGGHHRGIDLFSPVWNLLDLLPEGRENWMPKHFYDSQGIAAVPS
jgi:predicted dithiol-disulfide oxidoreductase (DUF899 family)